LGNSTWSDRDWTDYATSTRTVSAKTPADLFKATATTSTLNPLNIKLRESRDSAFNPESTPIIVALDETGSMGQIAVEIAKSGLGILFTEILDRKPVSDPHLMFMGVGDVHSDRSPLQVSQFEADAKIIEQLEQLHIEQNGGGNSSESYHFPWYFAATHTSIDSFEKRGKKGYLFTFGDELPPPPLTAAQIKQVCGDDVQGSLTTEELLVMASKMYHVFHIIIAEGNYARSNLKNVQERWRDLMGQHALTCTDYTKLSEIIVSTIQVIEGEEAASVTKTWTGATIGVVNTAIKDLVPHKQTSNGVVKCA